MSGTFRRFLLSKALAWFSAPPLQSHPFSAAGSVKQTPATPAENGSRFIVDYLMNSCGLSEKKAAAASASLVRMKCRTNPDSVLKFLRTTGLNDAQITSFVSRQPKLLLSDVEKFLAPKFKILQNLGMSTAEIVDIMQKTRLLRGRLDTYLVPRIEFLRSVLSNDKDLVKVLKRAVWSLTASDEICNRMLANISIFKELGVNEEKIKELIPKFPRVFQLKPELINTAISRVESELGIPHKSGMFFYAVCVLCILDPCKVKLKFRIFEEFGWSTPDITTLFRNQPPCLKVSDEKLRRGLEFLMRSAGFSASYIAKHPTLLMLNFEKRLLPRYNAFNTLKSKNLISKKQSFYAAVCMTEKTFLEKYVMKFYHMAPDVCEAYLNRDWPGKQ